MGEKEKVKDFNQNFNRILNKFPLEMKLHDSNTIGYYITFLPTNISSFVKRDANKTLALIFAEAIFVEIYFHTIGVVNDDDEPKDSNETRRKYQASSGKAKEKDSSYIEILFRTVRELTNEILELKRRSSEPSTSSKSPKFFTL